MNQLIQSKNFTTFLVSAAALICFGLAPMVQAVGPDTDGAIPGSNNGEGVGVLVSRTTGIWNTGTGFEALNNLTAGNQNTATGLRALFSDVNGGFNTATGVYSLFSNTSGFFNSATGAYALANNTTGSNNTANGYSALYFNTEGNYNTATGFAALYRNTTGSNNTANGYSALNLNATGTGNTAVGQSALESNTTGSGNLALGIGAGSSQTTGNNNIYIGQNILGVAGENDTCYIGSIFGQTSAGGTQVLINSSNKLGTITSSKRFKEEITPMDKTSEVLFALKPVTFRYKKEIDPAGTSQFGLVAEEVEKVNPDLVVRDNEGKPYSVCYEAVNAMLLNEFLKEHKAFVEENHKVEKLEAIVAGLVATVKEQAAQIQKMSAQIEANKPAPQMVLNNP